MRIDLSALPDRPKSAFRLFFLILLIGLWPMRVAIAGSADDITSGVLRLRDGRTADSIEAVRLGTDMDVHVSGQIARVKVTQAFRNNSNRWVEAVYVYPLPEDGAVDALKMVVGNRVIIGEIRKRAEARAIYEEAKTSGVTAGLIEQERPNIFSNAVANIGPGETVLISIEYQMPIPMRGGEHMLRLPLVVSPRYTPPAIASSDPAADRISPPVLDPRTHAPINPVSINVHLQSGFPLTNVYSRSHRIDIQGDGRQDRTVRLASGDVPADRDFVLSWRSAAATPSLGLFRQTVAGKHYLLAALTPPVQDRHRAIPPREMIFVIDNSGSMGGESMRQAKTSLEYALASLRPGDRFNVIRFDDTMTQLFPSAVPADETHVQTAMAFVRRLEASGGTEMLPALRAALVDNAPHETNRIRQVIFLTDGAISDEDRLLATLGERRGRSRVFMIGIGSAPNNFLMARAAEIGRGSFTHIGSSQDVEAGMQSLLDRLTTPIATDLKVVFEGVEGELTPALLPDLYVDEPLGIAAKISALAGRMRVSGVVDGKPWSTDISITDAVEADGVSKIWAKRRVADAEVARTLGKLPDAEADEAIVELGLEHGIVTSQTSLIAVDRTPRRPANTPLRREDLPINLPAGWDFDRLFGDVAAQRLAQSASVEAYEETIMLPPTGTDAELRLMCGLALMLTAAIGWGRHHVLRKRSL